MAQYQIINDTEYNEIQTKVAKVLGQTAASATFGDADDDYGYGQTVASVQVSEGSNVTALQWQNLTYDLLRCMYHQNGTNSSAIFAQTENILIQNPDGSYSTQARSIGYPYSATVNTYATQTSAITNFITVASTAGMNIGMTITFAGTPPAPDITFGNIVMGTTYYVFNIINATQIQISTTVPNSSTTALVLASKTAPAGSITVTASGSKGEYIAEKNRLRLFEYVNSNPANIVSNRLNIFSSVGSPPSNYTQRSTYNYPLTKTKFGPWNGTTVCSFKVDFGSHNAARYYFNAGGYFQITPTYTGGDVESVTDLDPTWSNICARVQNYIFRARSSSITGSGGSTVTVFGSPAGTAGFYNLSASPSLVCSSDAPTATAYDPNIALRIYATYNGSGFLQFDVSYYDAYETTGFSLATGGNESQKGTASVAFATSRPDGVDANGNITVSLPIPPATATDFT